MSGPDDPTGNGAPTGPEPLTGGEALAPAGTEAPPWVGELLADLRAQDPPIPDDVAERIDRALSVLTPTDVLPPTPGSADDPAGTHQDTGDDAPSPTGAATVVPLAARDRSTPSPWGHRLLLGGVAAAAALVLGGLGTVAVIRNTQGVPAGEAGLIADAGAPADRVRYVASNQDYTTDTLGSTAEAVLVASTTPLSATSTPPGAPTESATPITPTTPGVSATPGGTGTATRAPGEDVPAPAVVLRAATGRPTPSCLAALAGDPDVQPLLVDEATFTHRPAYVVLFATAGDAGSVDVWVVARTCATGDEGVLAFARFTR